MSLYIPAWLIWAVGLALGVPAVLLILVLAWFGWVALKCVGSPFK